MQPKTSCCHHLRALHHPQCPGQVHEGGEGEVRGAGFKLKVVERAGTKLEDIMYKSDLWQRMDCGGRSYLLCTSKS